MLIASELLTAIDAALVRDGGDAYRAALAKWLPKIQDIYRQHGREGRKHLGPSSLGHDCLRKAWYHWRKVGREQPEPRMIRLFNRGHKEEARIFALLDCAGCHFTTRMAALQFKELAGHFRGTADHMLKNMPGKPKNERVLIEAKSYNASRFAQLSKHGVTKSDPGYNDQMQLYMQKLGVSTCLFFAVNKNDDNIHAEWIMLDPDWSDTLTQKAELIIRTESAPPKLSEDQTFYKCKMCEHHSLCHRRELPEVNCRTCAHFGVDTVGGGFTCASKNKKLQNEVACERHVYHPELVGGVYDYRGGDGVNAEYVNKQTQETIINGPDGQSSKELKKCT